MVKVYYERLRNRTNVEFVFGNPVDRLCYGVSNDDVEGVVLEDGKILRAAKTILATGAWTSRLVKIDGVLTANPVGIAYIKLTANEMAKYRGRGATRISSLALTSSHPSTVFSRYWEDMQASATPQR